MSRKRLPVEESAGKTTAAKTISLPPDLLRWVDDQADAQGRSRSNWIAWALDCVKRKQPVEIRNVPEIQTERPAAKEPAAEPEKKGEGITPSASGSRRKLSPKSQRGAKKDRTNPPGQKNEPTNPP